MKNFFDNIENKGFNTLNTILASVYVVFLIWLVTFINDFKQFRMKYTSNFDAFIHLNNNVYIEIGSIMYWFIIFMFLIFSASIIVKSLIGYFKSDYYKFINVDLKNKLLFMLIYIIEYIITGFIIYGTALFWFTIFVFIGCFILFGILSSSDN